MLSRLKILFKYNGFIFLGYVQRYFNDGTTIYTVNYCVFDSTTDLESVEIYRSKGKDDRIFWRQRADEADPKFKDPELIEIIGKAIKIQENIES